MNYINLLLIIVVLYSIYSGIQRGFLLSSLSLLSLIGSLVAGFVSYRYLSSFLLHIIPSLTFWAVPFAFIIAVVATRYILDTIFLKVLAMMPRYVHKSIVNKALGILPGLVNGFIWSALLASFLLLAPLTNKVSMETRNGKWAERLIEKINWLNDKMSPIFSEAFNEAIPKNTVEVDAEEPVSLPFKVTDAKVRRDLEMKMLILVNKERKTRGLAPLKADPEMAVVAIKHCADMFKRSYFSHYTPEGIDPFDRMKKSKVYFLIAGENLAIAQTLAIAHDGLMRSPGHRANILNPSFGRVGIGILDGGSYGLMITQDFRN
ncbi:Colicin V production protein [Mucilaginibacter pineti]|uniref:Colicin V production protein n=1 Tax=Mucilaginibacter pineti TaxID=1391627 RepID=A0A1G6U9E4_9SPHI|nr:CvpA family protein [Mucilaginibacter pineti]SDD37207.1 Colicin V production protein [Mucilaginibacter pineti]